MFASLFGGEAAPAEGKKDGAAGSSDAGDTAAKLFGSLVSIAKDVGNVVSETGVKFADMSIVGDFQREQNKFISEQKGGAGSTGLPPWSGYENEDQLREQILGLSADKRNFLRDPPAGQTAFQFEYQKEFPTAQLMLQEDSNLSTKRFELVPKELSEENFWRNYFYRVYLLKQTCEVSKLATDAPSDSAALETTAAAPAQRPPPVTDLAEGAPGDALDCDDIDDTEFTGGLDGDLDTMPSAMVSVDLADLGGGADNEDNRVDGDDALRGEDLLTPPAVGEEASNMSTDAPSKPNSATPSVGASDGATSSDASWEKNIEAELESELSEFEIMGGVADVDDAELEDGWEDEMAAMLKEEDE